MSNWNQSRKLEDGTLSKEAVEPADIGSSEAVSYHSGKTGRFQNFIDSFKPPVFDEATMANMTAEEREAFIEQNSGLKRSLKRRHIQMIAIGSCIGTGLFVGTSATLSNGGPASVLIAYAIIGSMLIPTIQSLGELSIAFPVSGSFISYFSRFLGTSIGAACSYVYALLWLCTLPLELVAASMTVQYWNNEISPAAWVAIFWVFVVGINMFGAKGYGEAEFWFSSAKVVAVVGFVIFGIIYNCGGVKGNPYIGGKYYYDPGAFHQGFKGLCSVFVTAAFSVTGTEMTGVAAAETSNPRKTLPHAIKQVFWRMLIFYMASLIIVGLLVPYNDPRLQTHSGVSSSPFVIAIQNAGVRGLPSVMNVVILLAILSVANTSIYASSRMLRSLSEQKLAPKCFGYIDRSGRPVWGMLLSIVLGLLCFVSASSAEGKFFAWLMALNGLSSIFIWGAICMCHIRYRKAMRVQGKPLTELSYLAPLGIWGSWYGFVINILILAAQFWTGLWPVGGNGKPDVSNFFQSYLCAPVALVCLVVVQIWKRPTIPRSATMDVDTGRRQVDAEQLKLELELEKMEERSLPFYKRALNFWC